MEEKTKLVVLAALLHDIGKLLERGKKFSEVRDDETYLSCCPLSKDKSYRSHLHAAYSKRFCDYLEEKFDCLRNLDANLKEWKNWCGVHHRNDEMALESAVIRTADRLSSSEREEGTYFRHRMHFRTRLEPVLERVNFTEGNDNLATYHRYPLFPMSVDKEKLFPKHGEELKVTIQEDAEEAISDRKSWSHLLSDRDLVEEYEALNSGMFADIEAVAENYPQMPLEQMLSTMTSILERYTANVPSATNVRHPDISLFDHLRTSAAIAQALYLQQIHEDKGTRDLANQNYPKWILACGDFSGIQKFIYNLTNKGAARGLRGRSFYVQFFCRIAGEYILRQLGLCKLASLYDSGGKFYLLLPKYMQAELYKARDYINRFLLEEFEGSVYLGLGVAEITAEMFAQGNMHKAWKETAEDLERDRLRKFSSLLDNRFFEPQDVNPAKSCKVCGSRRVNKGKKCAMCLDLEYLGSWLRDAQAIILAWDEAQAEKICALLKTDRVVTFDCFGCRAILVSKGKFRDLSAVSAVDAECLFMNEFSEKPFKELSLPACAISREYIGTWSAFQSDNPEVALNFDQLASSKKGIERLGVLRMDVDNLGLVFIRGLNFPQRESMGEEYSEGWGAVVRESGKVVKKPMASISRMATLSRQLNQFFSGYVPYLLRKEEFDRCRIVYAGGDDLFVVGAWSQLPLLARQIRRDFSDFTCGNPDLTISGGMILQKSKYPIFKGAHLAGEAEEKAKEVRQKWLDVSETSKDGFCFQNVAIVWEDMRHAVKIKELLDEEGQDNRGLAAFLADMTANNKNMVQGVSRRKGVSESRAWMDIAFESWRWRSAYQLKRRYSKPEDAKKKVKWSALLYSNTLDGDQSTLPVISWLEFPLRWSDFEQRD